MVDIRHEYQLQPSKTFISQPTTIYAAIVSRKCSGVWKQKQEARPCLRVYAGAVTRLPRYGTIFFRLQGSFPKPRTRYAAATASQRSEDGKDYALRKQMNGSNNEHSDTGILLHRCRVVHDSQMYQAAQLCESESYPINLLDRRDHIVSLLMISAPKRHQTILVKLHVRSSSTLREPNAQRRCH